MKALFMAATAALLIASTAAEARTHHHHYNAPQSHNNGQGCVPDNSGRIVCNGPALAYGNAQEPLGKPSKSSRRQRTHTPTMDANGNGSMPLSRPPGAHHAWCGDGTSIYFFGRIVPRYSLAANWKDFPPAAPAIGMAAWRYGHVKAIIDGSPGDWICYDPNSGGGRGRIQSCGSLAGYHIVNPHGGTTYSARAIRRES